MKKKVFILSDEDDGSTDDVLDWISYLGYSFLRINRTTKITLKKVTIIDGGIDGVFTVNGVDYQLSEFGSYWYRRGFLNINEVYPFVKDNIKLNNEFSSTSEREIDTIKELLHFYFESLNGIGSVHENKTNKLVNMVIASQCGLSTPKTLITKAKKDVLDFESENSRVITKPSEQGGFVYENDSFVTSGVTELLNKEYFNRMPNIFFPSLFQEYAEKQFELRIFFLHGEFYSSAILSQLDEQTKIDFRNYNTEKPNRTPPFELPVVIKNKITKFMQRLNMDSGSLDFIVTPNDDFVFLEVNPVGQFFQVSFPCNFYLEKRIASYLVNKL